MSNTCSTTVYVYGEDENIDKLFSFLKELDVNNTRDISSRDIFDFMNTPENEIDDYRSGIIFYDADDRTIDIDSAWSEPRVLIDKMAEHFDVIMKWYAEEPGCGYYRTNDPSFNERGEYVTILAGEENFCNSEEEVVKYVNEYLEENFSDVPKISKINDLNKKDYYDLEINCFKYELVN